MNRAPAAVSSAGESTIVPINGEGARGRSGLLDKALVYVRTGAK